MRIGTDIRHRRVDFRFHARRWNAAAKPQADGLLAGSALDDLPSMTDMRAQSGQDRRRPFCCRSRSHPRNVPYVLECGPKAECDRPTARGGVTRTECSDREPTLWASERRDEERCHTTAAPSGVSRSPPKLADEHLRQLAYLS